MRSNGSHQAAAVFKRVREEELQLIAGKLICVCA